MYHLCMWNGLFQKSFSFKPAFSHELNDILLLIFFFFSPSFNWGGIRHMAIPKEAALTGIAIFPRRERETANKKRKGVIMYL